MPFQIGSELEGKITKREVRLTPMSFQPCSELIVLTPTITTSLTLMSFSLGSELGSRLCLNLRQFNQV